MKIAPKNSSERFLREHIAYDSDDCLLWPYCCNERGYGLAVVDGVQSLASRWMCQLAHGDPPSAEHEAAHSCGNPPCVNQKHLRWATPIENQADREIHGTTNKGERNGKTHLSAGDIRAIRAAAPDLKTLMARYSVSKGCISKIRSGQRWSHVQ
jgi:HNH endonuclease